MCRDGNVAGLAARIDEIRQQLQAAAAQAVELRETLQSAERALAEAIHDSGAEITVTPVRAEHADPA